MSVNNLMHFSLRGAFLKIYRLLNKHDLDQQLQTTPEEQSTNKTFFGPEKSSDTAIKMFSFSRSKNLAPDSENIRDQGKSGYSQNPALSLQHIQIKLSTIQLILR